MDRYVIRHASEFPLEWLFVYAFVCVSLRIFRFFRIFILPVYRNLHIPQKDLTFHEKAGASQDSFVFFLK